ncbi:hypothetical protein [Streptomyces sp. NPDC127105]|uniref:hypothetical protein n=1 Tax=Streptomyces sp. NPDC127105 TaxID=3345359 RepID=UPI003659B1AF
MTAGAGAGGAPRVLPEPSRHELVERTGVDDAGLEEALRGDIAVPGRPRRRCPAG